MNSSFLQNLYDFIAETEPLIENLDNLSNETVTELYLMYDTATKATASNIKTIDPELRVIACARQDMILERIVDSDINLEHENINGIFTPAVQGYRRWGNNELLKDKGLAGYILAKELDTRSIMMFCSNSENYTHKKVLPGLELLYSDAEIGDANPYYEHLYKEHNQMDVLVLHGMYNETIEYLNEYRKARPQGKVFCGLDMNRHWMSRILWDSDAVTRFSKQCNIIATSCRSLRDTLNRNPKVSFPCRWIPNGFFNLSNEATTACAEKKENIILTTGRIGSHQKNNAELLMAFQRAYNKLEGWKLRLVGTIEPDFKPFIDKYFTAFPYLVDVVTFVGAINEKDKLYEEYAQAKLFVLTSRFEGGTPNVYAEALFHGCMFITSDIDAADDITNFGELGLKYKLGDIDALANSLIQLSENTDKENFEKHISKALKYANKHFDWRRNAKKLAFMLYG